MQMVTRTVPIRADEKLVNAAKTLRPKLKDKFGRPKYPNMSRLNSAALEEFLDAHMKEGAPQ